MGHTTRYPTSNNWRSNTTSKIVVIDFGPCHHFIIKDFLFRFCRFCRYCRRHCKKDFKINTNSDEYKSCCSGIIDEEEMTILHRKEYALPLNREPQTSVHSMHATQGPFWIYRRSVSLISKTSA